ncbi:hypothetical protein Q3G72_016571 [Acer saccharum]|nr:hypothetical protein Q3G72_016571 [Acer saccharum]
MDVDLVAINTIQEKPTLLVQISYFVHLFKEEEEEEESANGRQGSYLFGTVKLGPLGGGTGGGGWDFNPGPHSSITEIEIVHGVVVDSIYIKSVNRKTGRSEFSGKHGGNGGGSTLISITEPDEYITSISGTTRTFNGHLVVESLTFNTNKTRYGPYGNTTGNGFGIPMENGEIVGFFGRAGDFIDAIGIYVKPSC